MSETTPFSDAAEVELSMEQLVKECAVVRDRFRVILETPGYAWLREVKCHYVSGVVTLDGHVPSFYLRQVAQRLAREIPGVKEIVDRLKVY